MADERQYAYVQFRRGNQAYWDDLDSKGAYLLLSEPGVLVQDGPDVLKLGDGVSKFANLPVYGGDPDLLTYDANTESYIVRGSGQNIPTVGNPGNIDPTVAGYFAGPSDTRDAADARYAAEALFQSGKPFKQRTDAFGNSGVFVQGAKGDYTGRRGAPGTGTDDRAAIQAALNAATQPNGPSWYSYLQGRTVTVKLPAGAYLIGAPNSGASLVVPRGVHLDTSDAMLFFDYPATADRSWAGIQVEPEGSLTVGMLQPSGRNTPADTKQMYDGVRVFGSDNYWSKVAGLPGRHNEIKGFQGASVRLVGTWVTYLDNIHFTSQVGVIMSSLLPNNVYGYTIPSDMPFPTNRGMTDVFITNCYFDGTSYGGIVGPITGTDATSNIGGGLDFSNGALQLYIHSTLFEQMNALPIYVTGYCVSLVDVAFEETGNSIAQLAWFQTVRSVYIQNFRVNFTGVNVPGPNGPGSSRPIGAFRTANVLGLTIDGGYVHNTVNNSIFLVQPDSSLPGAFHVGPVIIDSLDYKQNAAYGGQRTIATSSAWNAGHLSLGGNHVWNDATGILRQKSAAPTSDTDGTIVGSQIVPQAWNGQHLILGAYHLWVDANGSLRIKSGAPTSDTDGMVVGTQS